MRHWLPLARWLNRAAPTEAETSSAEEGDLLDRRFLAQIEQLRLADLGTVLAGLTGEHQGRSKTQAIEFADYRGYVPGDDFRQIDWNAYARLGELFVKSSVTEENTSLSLLIDCSRSMDWGRPNKLRYARRLAAALGVVALLHYDSVRVYALGDGRAEPGTPLSGQGALPLLLREIESLPVAATTNILPGIESFRSESEQQGVTVLISDLLVPENQEIALGYLAGDRSRAAVLHVVDPLEAEPAMNGLLELRDHETGQTMEITVTPSIRKRYMERFQAWTEALEARCKADQIRYIRIPTSVSPSDVMLDVVRRQGLVRV